MTLEFYIQIYEHTIWMSKMYKQKPLMVLYVGAGHTLELVKVRLKLLQNYCIKTVFYLNV